MLTRSLIAAMLPLLVAAGEPPPASAPAQAPSPAAAEHRGRGARREPLTPEEIEAVIAVAADISPEWGTTLRARFDKDPESVKESIATNGGRFLYLSMLKKRHPDLYAVCLDDLRIQNDLKALSRDYQAAKQGGQDAKAVEQKIRAKVTRQVDLDFKARALGLQALDQQIKTMLVDLTGDTQDRNGKIDRVFADIQRGEEPKTQVHSSYPRGDRGADRAGRDSKPGGAAPTREQMEPVLAVAAEIDPEWGRSLRTGFEKDPASIRETLSADGGRLYYLSILKRRHPELYTLRVDDIKVQNELRSLARQYHAAQGSASPAEANELEKQIRAKITRQVDFDLKARALELQALDQQIKKMIEDLTVDTRDREAKVDRVVEEIKSGEEPRTQVRPPFGGDRGRDGRDGRDARQPRGDTPAPTR